MHKLIDPQYQDAIQRQIGQDLSNRSLIGTVVYILIWAAIMLPSLIYANEITYNTMKKPYSAAVLINATLFILISAIVW